MGGGRLVQYLVEEPGVTEETPEWLDDSAMDDEEGGRGRRRGDGEQAQATHNRFGIEGPEDPMDPHMAREEAKEMAQNAGIIGILKASNRVWGAEQALGNDPTSALGSLMADQLGSSFAIGGMGMLGTGGGGTGTGTGTARSPLRAAHRPIRQGVIASTFVGGRGQEARLQDQLARGVKVDGQQVKLAAFEDRTRLRYPLPLDRSVALHAELERSVLYDGDERVHLQIALTARRDERPRRPRIDLRLVLDASGSMEGASWHHALAAARALVARLRPRDRFALITYSDSARVAVKPGAVRRAVIDRELDRLGREGPGGGTNLGAALSEVAAAPPRRRGATDVALVVVISDGMVTRGPSDPTELGGIARGMFERGGVITTSVGLGDQFDEETMVALAREGAGSYHFVRNAGDVEQVLQDELDTHLQAVAQALRLRVELGDGVSVAQLYGSRLLDDGERARVRGTERATDARLARELGIARDRDREPERGLRMHIPSFRRGEQHVVLMELSVPAGADVTRIAKVSLDYKDLLTRDNREARELVSAERTDDRARAAASIAQRVKRTVLAFQAGQALQRAADALGTGAQPKALALLQDHHELLVAGARHFHDRALERDAALLQSYAQVVDHGWLRWGYDQREALAMAMRYQAGRRMR